MHSTPGFKGLLWVFWLLQDLHNWGCSTNQYALMVLRFWTFEGPLPCELEVGTVDSVLWYLKQQKKEHVMLHVARGYQEDAKKCISCVVFRELTWSLSLASQLFGYSVGHGKPMDGGKIPLVCRQQAYLHIYSLSFSLRNPFLVDQKHTQSTHHQIIIAAGNLVNLSRGTCRSKGQGVLMNKKGAFFHSQPEKKTPTPYQSEGRKEGAFVRTSSDGASQTWILEPSDVKCTTKWEEFLECGGRPFYTWWIYYGLYIHVEIRKHELCKTQ